ncbi:MAG TPA: hypothetical protein VMO47_05165 [Rhodothermales bacterium]|nr:hypothetical protein [Rhodothermales bacterium]
MRFPRLATSCSLIVIACLIPLSNAFSQVRSSPQPPEAGERLIARIPAQPRAAVEWTFFDERSASPDKRRTRTTVLAVAAGAGIGAGLGIVFYETALKDIWSCDVNEPDCTITPNRIQSTLLGGVLGGLAGFVIARELTRPRSADRYVLHSDRLALPPRPSAESRGRHLRAPARKEPIRD